MGKTIIPVGKTLGPYVKDGKLKYVEHYMGGRLEELTVDETMVWACAHENGTAHYERKFGRTELNAAIESQNNTLFNHDRDLAVARLFELGALIEVDFETNLEDVFLKKYRLLPTGLGFGNSADEPGKFGVGYGERPEVFMGLHAYYLWAMSNTYGSMWAACTQMEADNPKVTASQVGRDIAEMIPILIASRCAFIELTE